MESPTRVRGGVIFMVRKKKFVERKGLNSLRTAGSQVHKNRSK